MSKKRKMREGNTQQEQQSEDMILYLDDEEDVEIR